jgi:hypothetical protein
MPKRKVEKPSEEYDQVTGVDYYNTKKVQWSGCFKPQIVEENN